MIYHDGWYYLLVTHGSCCAGANSTLQHPHGPRAQGDRPVPRQHGRRHARRAAASCSPASRGRHVGPGHFGLLDLGDGVQKFSLHYEADLDRGGISVLDIRPLLWRDGWPVAGDNLSAGTYQIESARTGTVLELAVQGVAGGRIPRAAADRGGGPDAAQRPPPAGRPIPRAGCRAGRGELAGGAVDVRMAPAHAAGPAEMDHRAGRRMPAAIRARRTSASRIAGTDRALAADRGRRADGVPAFTGAPEQLWRIDQLADGTYRADAEGRARTHAEPLALSAVGSSTPTLATVRSRQRSPALAAQGAVIAARKRSLMTSPRPVFAATFGA